MQVTPEDLHACMKSLRSPEKMCLRGCEYVLECGQKGIELVKRHEERVLVVLAYVGIETVFSKVEELIRGG